MAAQEFKRKLAAILSADAVGYSRLMGEDETGTLKTLENYKRVFVDLIEQHRGRLVGSPGDNLLAEFASVVDAVQCGVAVQKELQARNLELPESARMQFRIGINLGDVIEEADSLYGDGVNIAARLEALADPGGICVSKTAFDHIETKLPLGYEFLGEQAMKNIARPVGAYRVVLEPRITVAGQPEKEKTRPPAWSRQAVIGATVLAGLAAIALALWQGAFWPAPPMQPGAVPAPQSQALPPPREVLAPAPAVQGGSPPPTAPEAARPAPMPSPPAAEARPGTRLATPRQSDKNSALFKMFDANQDGKVTLSEFLRWREEQFHHFETNRDGSLSRGELAAAKNSFARLLESNFELIDTNRDQKLSREEFHEASRRRFLIMDTNRDGYLAPAELEAGKARQ